MPADSVVKELRPRPYRGAPFPMGRSNIEPKIKNPASSAGLIRPHTLDGFARCSTSCYPVFVSDLVPSPERDSKTTSSPDSPSRCQAIQKYNRIPDGVKCNSFILLITSVKISAAVEIKPPERCATLAHYSRGCTLAFFTALSFGAIDARGRRFYDAPRLRTHFDGQQSGLDRTYAMD
jgi:hypothetical protein